MIVHIVMFKFKDEKRDENILKTKEMLESLVGKIYGLKKMEVGVNFNNSERAFDLSLYSTFESKEDLSIYATHAAHLEVVKFIKDVTSESKVVDYEIN